MMATVPHVSSGLGLTKFQADGFLLTQVYYMLNAQFFLQSKAAPHTDNPLYKF